MKCLKCGHRNKAGAHYCVACGSELKNEAKSLTNVVNMTRLSKRAALFSAGLISVFAGVVLVHGKAKPTVEEASQKIIAMYKGMLSDEKIDVSDFEHLQKTGTTKLKWVFANEDPEKVCYSYANYDLNHDGTDELLIARGWDQDGDGIRDVYALGENNYTDKFEEFARGDDEAKDYSEGSPMNVDMVYVFNGKEMVPVDDQPDIRWQRSYFHMFDNGLIYEFGVGAGYNNYGGSLLRIMENGKIEKDTFYMENIQEDDSSSMFAGGDFTINGEEVSVEEFNQFGEKIEEEFDQAFDSAGMVDFSQMEWKLFWPEEEASAND